MEFPSHDELIEAYRAGLAVISVDRINHREFVKDGIRYFCGYTSRRSEFESLGKTEPCWFTYKSEPNTVAAE